MPAAPIAIADLCALAPVIPVLVVDDLASAGPLARALSDNGLRALEITLRTPVALDAMRAMADAAPDAVVGAGTLRTAADVKAAVAAGARFGVSPGLTRAVAEAAAEAGLPLLPGVATPTEAMEAADRGFEYLKFFPAAANGGPSALGAWASPLAGLKFCPTGGVTPQTAPEWLRLKNVVCVGGSWMAPAGMVASGAWEEIGTMARVAAALKA